jgi:hypothetical protein
MMVGGAAAEEAAAAISGFGELESALEVCGDGGRLSDREASGERP